ncbi:hypothetical protein ACFPM1_15270, partial [Halorubrum rubrum]
DVTPIRLFAFYLDNGVVGFASSETTEPYIAEFGFDLRATSPDARFVAAGRYHHHVGANTWNGRTEPAAGRGIDWFEVVVPDDEGRRSLRERLGGEDSESLAGNGFAVADPDGIAIRVVDGS